MFVEQLENKNQFIIYNEGNIYFQSYKSLIAKIDNNNVLTIYKDWDYSKTTLKHLKIFLTNNAWQGKLWFDWNKPFKRQIEKYLILGNIIKGW